MSALGLGLVVALFVVLVLAALNDGPDEPPGSNGPEGYA